MDDPANGTRRLGRKVHTAKLHEDDIQEIRRLRNSEKLSYKVIGAKFGVTLQAIYYITSGKHWKHIC